MRHVQSRNAYDCGVAALATFAECSYEEVAESLPFKCDDRVIPENEHRIGLHPQEAYLWLYRRDIPCWYLETKTQYLAFADHQSKHDGEVYQKRWEMSPMLTAQVLRRMLLAEQRTALVQVDSMTVQGQFHWIVYDGFINVVSDPQFAEAGVNKLDIYQPYIAIIEL